MAMEARKVDTSRSEDAEIVSKPEKVEEKRPPGDDFAEKYWEKVETRYSDPEKAKEFRAYTEKTIADELERMAQSGKLEMHFPGKKITDEDREKIFAYKKYAIDHGYKVGPYGDAKEFSGVVADISKERGKVIDFLKYKERISDLFSKDGKEIGAKKALEEIGGVLSRQFSGWKKKYEGFNIDPREVLSKAGVKKIFGADSLKFWAGFATGGAIRSFAKWGIGASGGFLASMGIGALAGGSTEFIRTIISEKKRLKENPLSEDQVLAKAKEISASNENIKKKLDEYLSLEILQTGYPEFGKVEIFRGHKAELYQALRKEIKADSIDWKKVRSGVVKGAIYGALGGALGSAVSHFVFGVEDAKEIAKAAKEAGVSLSDEVKSKIHDEVSDVYSKAFESSFADGGAALEAKEFFAMADKGDSLTTMSRNLIHDYISQKQALGVEIALDKSQLIYAEDALKNIFEGRALSPGDELSLLGGQIKSAIEKAQLLTSTGKEHIKAEYASKIGDKAWEEILNYDSPFHDDNNFSEGILKKASDEAATAVNDAKESIAQELAYQEGSEMFKDKVAVKAAEKATHSYLKDFLEIAGIGAAFKIRQYRERKKKSKETIREHSRAKDFSEGDSDLRPEPKKKDEYIDLKEEDVFEKSDEKLIDNILPEKASDEYLDRVKKVKTEEKVEGKTESTAKETKEYFELDERLIDQPLGERASDEYKETVEEKNKRFAKDPFYKFLRGERLDIKPGWISYIVTGYNKGDWKKFDSFEELKSWYKDLSPEEREKVKKQDREGKTRAVFMNIYPPLRNYLNNNEDLKNRFNSVVEKNISALFRERRGKIVSKNEENFEEIRGTEIGNEAPYPPEVAEQNIDRKDDYEQEIRSPNIGNEAPYPPASEIINQREPNNEKSERQNEGLKIPLFDLARKPRKQEKVRTGLSDGGLEPRIGNGEPEKRTAEKKPEEINYNEIYRKMNTQELLSERKKLNDEMNIRKQEMINLMGEVKEGGDEEIVRNVQLKNVEKIYRDRLDILRDIIETRYVKEKRSRKSA